MREISDSAQCYVRTGTGRPVSVSFRCSAAHFEGRVHAALVPIAGAAWGRALCEAVDRGGARGARRYKAAADAAHSQFLAILQNHSALEQQEAAAADSSEAPARRVFDGRDAAALAQRAAAAAEGRELDAERREREYAAASRAGAAARLAAKAARERSAAAREAAASAAAAERHSGAFTSRDEAAAEAAAERQANKEEDAWEDGVAR